MRSFHTRRVDILKQLWKTLIQCHIDYCSQLYMPGQAQGMLALEKLFYDFTLKIPEVREESYWKKLQISKMLSQETRLEQYKIIYVWKILEGLVPNCGVNQAKLNSRLGQKCIIPSLKPKGRQANQTLREQSFQINRARLFKLTTKEAERNKNLSRCFKAELDKYLSTVPD